MRGLLQRAGVPLVLDADALNAFAEAPELLVGAEGRDVIITPHPGELARLVGVTTADVQANRIEVAQGFAETHQLYVVLKGHRSIIATPEGHVFVNPTGNPGMATGGMGDLLTGMVAAWLAQLLDAEAACKLAVYLHGLAGDLAEAAEGEVALTPSDVARAARRRGAGADGAQEGREEGVGRGCRAHGECRRLRLRRTSIRRASPACSSAHARPTGPRGIRAAARPTQSPSPSTAVMQIFEREVCRLSRG